MRKNRMIAIVLAVFVCIFTLNSTLAVEIFDTKTSSSVYKVSEDDSTFEVPFARIIENRIEIDKSISQVGLFMSTSSIEVTEPLEGVQLFYSGDTVRLNSDTEYPIIVSTGNVIINGTIKKTTLIYCKGTITIGEDANIKQNLICYTPKLEINGVVDGNILGVIQDLCINNTVNGKIKAEVSQIECLQNAKVEKGLELNTSNESLTVPETVGEAKIDVATNEESGGVREYLLKVLIATLANIVIFLIVVIFAKKERLEKVGKRLTDSKEILKNGVFSYLILLACILFGIVLLPLLTKLGVVLLVFSGAVMTIVTLLKNVIFGMLVGYLTSQREISKDGKKMNVTVSTMLTLLILELIGTIPYVGEVFKFITFIIALGMLCSLIFKKKDVTKIENNEKVIEVK